MNLWDIVFPKKCVGCKKVGSYLCQSCQENIFQGELVCPICEKSAIGGATHPLCQGKWKLDGLWSLGVYQGNLRQIIQKLKYKGIEELAQVIVNLLVEYWARYNPHFLTEIKKTGGEDWLIVPVPLHWTRQNWRGFNQSEAIGQTLSKKIGLHCQDVLKRTRITSPQVGKDAKSRKANIFGAFALNVSHIPSHILLIDDVWTTGSTLRECAYVLKRAGAKKVWAITVAR